MACLKRLLDGQDPDYEDSAPNEAKRLRLLEQNAKADVSQKVCAIIEREFNNELANKEKESIKIQERLHQAQKTLHLLRYAIVRNYYMRNEQGQETSQQTRIHPAVKKLIGKQPQRPFWEPLEQRPSRYRHVNSSTTNSSCFKSEPVAPESLAETSVHKLCNGTESSGREAVPSATKITKVPRYIPPKPDSSKIQPQIGLSRGLRHKVKKRLVIGNISKWIPVDMREDSASHKWMIYVRGPREAPDISGFVSKVRFFLHPSFRPNDVVEVTSPPFHLSRRGWGEFPVRVQVHFSHPMNKPVDLLHHLKLDRSYTGLQRLGAETVVDVWLYAIPTSINHNQGENDSSSGQIELKAFGNTDSKDIWNLGDKENAFSCTNGSSSPAGEGLLPSPAASNSVEVDGHFTVTESFVSSGSLKSENVCVKEESGIESCGSSDVSEPPVGKTELNTYEEGVNLCTIADSFDYNVTIKEELIHSDDCTNLANTDFNLTNIKQENMGEDVQDGDSIAHGSENLDLKPEFISTMFDHDYFGCVEPSRTFSEVVNVVANEHKVEKPIKSLCSEKVSDVSFSRLNGTQDSFSDTKISSSDSIYLNSSSLKSTMKKLNGTQIDCSAPPLLDSPEKQMPALQKDVQGADVARKPATLVKCLDASGNVFYITLASSCTKLDQASSQTDNLCTTIANPQFSRITRTSCDTVTTTSTTITTAGLYSGTNVSQSTAVGERDMCLRSTSVHNPGNTVTQNVVNVSMHENKTRVSTSSLPSLEIAKSMSNMKTIQVANNLKCLQTGKGLLNVVQSNAYQLGSSKKVVLMTPTTSVLSSVSAKQTPPTLLTSSASVRAISSGMITKPNQTMLLLRDGQYYVVKQPQDAVSPSAKSLLAVPERESASQTVIRVPQQPGIIFKMPATGSSSSSSSLLNGSARFDSLPLSMTTFQTKPGCSLLKKKVRCAQSPPPLSPISKPPQLPTTKAKLSEDVKVTKNVELPVVPMIKKVDRKMIVLNRTHGPITAATTSRASYYEENLKAAVEVCKFPNQMLCVRWLLRHLPLVSSNVSDHNFRTIHPYAAPSREAFLEWNIGKQRAAEWLRAKKVQKLLLKLSYSEENVWSTRAIVIWARLHGYTPVAQFGSNIGFKTGNPSCSIAEKKSTFSEPVQIVEWLETNGSSSLTNDEDIEIDVVGLRLPLRAVKQEDVAESAEDSVRLEVLEHDRLHEADCMFVREKVRELGFKMSSEQIIPGIMYCAAERLMLEAMKSLAEDLLRRALCKAWMRNSNRPPETLTAADVMEALLGRPEFDLFTNFGLGVQAADTG